MYPKLAHAERIVSSYNEKVFTELRIHQVGDDLYEVGGAEYAPAWKGARDLRRSRFTLRDGVARWVSNGSVLMADVVRDNCIDKVPGFVKSVHEAAYAAHLDEFMRAYRKLDPEPSREIMDEARADGAKVLVNVLTGRRTRL